MKVAYISGPYRAATEYAVRNNILRAGNVALRYWAKGYAVICPHMNTAFFGGALDDSVWLEGDLRIMTCCDVVVMMKGWEASTGASAEHSLAKSLGMQILYDEEPTSKDLSLLTRIWRWLGV